MSRMTKPAAERLAEFIHQYRRDLGHSSWDPPGIVAALGKAAPLADATDVVTAITRLAENGSLRTPAILPDPGPHWPTREAGAAPRRGDHTMTCPEHAERLPCGQCVANAGAPPAEVLGDIRAALDAAKTTHHQRDAEKAAREQAKEKR